MPNPPNLPRIAVLIALVSLVAIAASFVAVLEIAGGVTAGATPAVITVLGFVLTIITQLLLAFAAGANERQIKVVSAQAGDIQDKINGHLATHVDEAVASAVAEKVSPGVNDPQGGPPGNA